MDPTKATIELYFDFILKKHNKKLLNDLNHGLTLDEITELTSEINIELPSDAATLFTIRNGLKYNTKLTVGQSLLFDNGIMLPLERGIKEYKTFMFEPELDKMFPLFDSGGGDFLLIDCDTERDTYGKIKIYAPALEIIEPQLIYSSVLNLETIAIRGFMQNAYSYDKSGCLTTNDSILRMIANEVQPDINYWKTTY